MIKRKEKEIPIKSINGIYYLLIALVSIVITVALYYTRSIMIPFAIALFIYAMISPGAEFFKKKFKIPKVLSFFIFVIIFILILIVLSSFISQSVEQFITGPAIYKENIVKFIKWSKDLLTKYGIDVNIKVLEDKIKEMPFFTIAKDITSNIFSFLGDMFLIIIFVFFLIIGKEQNRKVNPVIDEISHQITKYIWMKILFSFITGLLIWILLVIMKVELAFMFGVFTMLLNFIPNVGSIIATLLPLPVVLLQFGFGWQFTLILLISFAIQFSIGNIIEPRIQGESLNMHPVTILLFLIFWGLVWGIPGMFLAVPITVILKIILSKLKPTRSIAILFEGRLPDNFLN